MMGTPDRTRWAVLCSSGEVCTFLHFHSPVRGSTGSEGLHIYEDRDKAFFWARYTDENPVEKASHRCGPHRVEPLSDGWPR